MFQRVAISTFLLGLILLAAAAQGAPETTRIYASVQDGYIASAPEVSTFAPGRVMVQFTREAYETSLLNVPMELDAKVAGNRTGLASVDAMVEQIGVVQILKALIPARDADLAYELGLPRRFRFDLPEDADVLAIAERLAADPNVEHATPDWRLFPAYIPNDPTYIANWGHDNTAQMPAANCQTWLHTGSPVGMHGFDADVDMAWDLPTGFGSPGVIIAILDTGVDQIHMDLTQVGGWDYGDNDPNPHDDSAVAGHGTCCAGIAAAMIDNSYLAAGVAGGCAIMPLKVADTAGNLYFSYAANALTFAANNGAQIASMSFGAYISSDPNLDAAITYAYSMGVTMLAAASNENVNTLSYPANMSEVIAVGAASPCGDRKRSSSNPAELAGGVSPDPLGTTCDNECWWGSNYGSNLQDTAGALDVLAPTMLPTTDITGFAGYQTGDLEPWFNGTSCSTPYAAGVCALILSANPALSPAQVRAQLVSTATDVVNIESTPGWDRYSGYGLVNAYMAVVGASVPVANFMAVPTSGCQPLMVQFADLSGGVVTNWSWDFGDGGVDFIPNPAYVYNVPGTYTVTLTVSGPGGGDIMVQTNLITVDGPSISDFTASPTSGLAPLTVNFVDTSLDNPTNWHWDFGDGFTSTAQFPSHTYQNPGFYTVTLTTSNACGGVSMTKDDYIEAFPPEPIAEFAPTDTSGCVPLTVGFTYVQMAGPPDTWSWDFGDGGITTTSDPSHTYTGAGSYDVTLIVTNAAGADTLTRAACVVVDSLPAADFSADPLVGADTQAVDFTDLSAGGPSAWDWDFGDGGTSTEQNPSHTYMSPGRYTVTLIAGNACDADTLAKTDYIVIATTTEVIETPRRFTLGPNHPNPFNPSTTIDFSLASAGQARLEIFDIYGRSRAVLVDGRLGAGPHQVTWQPRQSASGVYFAKLSAAGKTALLRMVLIR